MFGNTGPGSGPGSTRAAYDEHASKVLGGTAVGIVAVATVVYRLLEDWSWVDSFYFSVVAVTTVGFGDLSPSTDASKLFTVGYIVAGIGIIGLYLNHRIERVRRRRESKAGRKQGEDNENAYASGAKVHVGEKLAQARPPVNRPDRPSCTRFRGDDRQGTRPASSPAPPLA